MTLTVWCNADLGEKALAELREGLQGHRLIIAESTTSNLASSGLSQELSEAQIAFGQPDPRQVVDENGLKWVQLTSAGYTRYDTPEVALAIEARGAVLTNSSSVYDEPCAQHLLSFMLAQARQLPQAVSSQVQAHRWDYEVFRPKTRLLEGRVLIVGYGAIGERLVELLAPFEVEIVGIRRRLRGDEPIEMHPVSDLSLELPRADHIVNVLPANAQTNGLFNDSMFQVCKPGAVFYNVGRGTTVDQIALARALEDGLLSAAYLDVTDPEPLPPESPLWTAPNCWITPHIAGGHGDELKHLVRHFLANFNRFLTGEPLRDVVFRRPLVTHPE